MPQKPTKPSKTKPHDFAQAAFRVVRIATGEEQSPTVPPEKDHKRVAAGRKGGKKGGPMRARKLSSSRRRAIAKKAALVRWHKQ